MQLTIVNLTGSTRTYLSGAVSVPGSGSTSVTNTTQQLSLATDGSLRSDLFGSLVQISDGTNTYGANDALIYLALVTQNIGPTADSSGNGITSTTINSKQRLDINAASDGAAGSAVPFHTTLIGGSDGTNLRALKTDTSGLAIVNAGIVETTAPGTKSSGTATQLVTDEFSRLATVPVQQIEAEWGRMFTASSNVTVTTGTTETAFLYIKNPNASGATAKFLRMMYHSQITSNSTCIYRLYKNPTVTANGTTVTPVGNRQSGQAATILNIFTVPTVTANGSFMKSFVLGFQQSIDDILNFSLWLEPNNSYLITRQCSTNSTIGGVNLEWTEQ